VQNTVNNIRLERRKSQ